MKKRKDILYSDSRGVIPTAKGSRLLDTGFFNIMRNPTIENETADSLLDGEFVTTILGTENYRHLVTAAGRQKADVETYAQAAILRSVAADLGVAFEGKMLVTLDLPAKTAAKLRKAAEFEELSVEEYLMDGLKRDLSLSKDLMAANGGAR